MYVAIATKPVHRLQINPSAQQCTTRDTPTIPPICIRVRAVVLECGEGQADTQTAVANIDFASATPHAKRKYFIFPLWPFDERYEVT